jgi:hypothetical protein
MPDSNSGGNPLSGLLDPQHDLCLTFNLESCTALKLMDMKVTGHSVPGLEQVTADDRSFIRSYVSTFVGKVLLRTSTGKWRRA